MSISFNGMLQGMTLSAGPNITGPITRASEDSQYCWAEGILYRVMKLKNPIVSKGRESGNTLS